jgi:tetraacyldisaccharide 4'-kinase
MLDYQPIMSGQRTDALAGGCRAALAGLSVPYRFVIACRNQGYDRALWKTHSCGVPVVSVGNLTTGGTGKTPIVGYLAKWFLDRSIQPAIVSRGYGGQGGKPNDEALELAARLPTVPHVQNPDRVVAARMAIEQHGASVIIADDGFQHRRLTRDLDLVVIDATCPFGFGHLLPRGLLREPPAGLRRADLVVLTRCDAVSETAVLAIQQTILKCNPRLPVLRSQHRPISLLEYPNSMLPIQPENVAAVSAIGNPAAFEQSLRQSELNVIDTLRLPDHDPYQAQAVDRIARWIESLGNRIDRVVCTHKDLVKLRATQIGRQPLAALMIELTFSEPPSVLDEMLQERIQSRLPDPHHQVSRDA